MQNAIELNLTDTEKRVIGEVAAESRIARAQIDAAEKATLSAILRLHGHKDGRLIEQDGKLYVLPAGASPEEVTERTDTK